MSARFTIIASFLCSAALTPVWIAIAKQRQWLVRPRPDRWSRQEAAKFGGLPLLLCFFFAAELIGLQGRIANMVGLTLLMASLGLIDDLKCLRPVYKLAGEIVVAAVAIWSGFICPLTSTYVVNAICTLMFLVAVTNAFNLLDNMDGLAAGVGAIAALSLSLALDARFEDVAQLTACMGACLAGFLIYNFQPARIFMGDTGSLPLGFFLALAATAASSTGVSLVITQALVFVVPMFDTTLVIVTRWLNSRAFSAGAKDHSSHRLVWLGLSERQAVLTLYLLAATGCGVAMLHQHIQPALANLVLVSFSGLTIVWWVLMAAVRLPASWLSPVLPKPSAVPMPRGESNSTV